MIYLVITREIILVTLQLHLIFQTPIQLSVISMRPLHVPTSTLLLRVSSTELTPFAENSQIRHRKSINLPKEGVIIDKSGLKMQLQ
jgi:hypothetical protein